MLKVSCLAVIIIVLSCSLSHALTVTGLPEWLSPSAQRAIRAVWSEIPSDEYTDRERTLEIVASRLFTGYRVTVEAGINEPSVIFTPQEQPPKPQVRITMPELRGYALSWFSKDVNGLADEVSSIAEPIPQGAYTWTDTAFRERLREIISVKLPGWEFSHQIYIEPSSTRISISFVPSTDMVLAVKPELTSRTIPVMFRSDLEAKLLPELSPLIGLPVKWVSHHTPDIEELITQSLSDRNTIGNLKAEVRASFKAGRISQVYAEADSDRYRFGLWLSAYALMEGKAPDAGIYFGFRPMWRIGEINLAPEIYAEGIIGLEDFGLIYRAGLKFETIEKLWLGMEYEISGGRLYLRCEYEPLKSRRPYGYMRLGMGARKYEIGGGYRIDEHMSCEIYYDGRIGLRGKWNL